MNPSESNDTGEVFGPVPSRRLGRSLGLNNIPPKHCTYSCVYCQVGRTDQFRIRREPFYPEMEFFRSAKKRVAHLRQQEEPPDHMTFVPDGEPTLDVNLGSHIRHLRSLGIPIAVISNGSLLWQPAVRQDLHSTDWCSLKVDTVEETVWRRINRPHRALRLRTVLQGMRDFSREYRGELVTETMLVEDLNDTIQHLKQTAGFIAELQPSVAYIAAPTRPPAESWVKVPSMKVLNIAFHVFTEVLDRVELLIDYEGDQFISSGNVEQDVLDITAVHPMRRSGIDRLLRTAGGSWTAIENLLQQEQLVEVEYEGEQFYVRNLKL